MFNFCLGPFGHQIFCLTWNFKFIIVRSNFSFEAIGMDSAAGKLGMSARMTGFESTLIAAGRDSICYIYRGGWIGFRADVMGGIVDRNMAIKTIGRILYAVFYLGKMKCVFIGFNGFQAVTGHFFSIFMTAGA